MAQLLITGGAGFIGSHTCLVLAGSWASIFGSGRFQQQLSSRPGAGRRTRLHAPAASSTNPGGSTGRIHPVEGDVQDIQYLDGLFASAKTFGQPIDAVIHFAGLKSVGESLQQPLCYWEVNVVWTQRLLSAVDQHHCCPMVSSSIATLYG